MFHLVSVPSTMVDDDKVDGGNINLVLEELATQLKEVVAQRTTDHAFIVDLAQRADAVEQRPGVPPPYALADP